MAQRGGRRHCHRGILPSRTFGPGDGPKKGFCGIAVVAQTALTSVALLEYVDGAERMCCVLRTHIGGILFANCYRPPDDDGSSMDQLLSEFRRLRSEVVGTIVLGDINIHHRKWLRHSNGNTAIGERLLNICHEAGLKQVVREPTRGEYLLDLVWTDIRELLSVSVLLELSDRRVVCVDMRVTVPLFVSIPRFQTTSEILNGAPFVLETSAEFT